MTIATMGKTVARVINVIAPKPRRWRRLRVEEDEFIFEFGW
jgi:hypothetical protein